MNFSAETEPMAPTPEQPRHPARRAFGHIVRSLGILFAAGLAAALILLVLLPRFMGWVPLTVLSGSMEPSIPIGSQVVVDRVQTPQELAAIVPGDVISFMPQPDDPSVVTHRVVAQGVRADGSIVLTTRGDANGADDPDPIGLQQIRGVSRYHIPYAGYVASFLDVREKQTGTIAIAVLLFGYAGWNLIGALRERRQPESESDFAVLDPIADEQEPSP